MMILNHLHDKLLVSRQAEPQDAKVDRGSQVVRVGDEAELPGDHHDHDDGGDGGDEGDGLTKSRIACKKGLKQM